MKNEVYHLIIIAKNLLIAYGVHVVIVIVNNKKQAPLIKKTV